MEEFGKDNIINIDETRCFLIDLLEQFLLIREHKLLKDT